MNALSDRRWLHCFFLLLSLVVGAGLRLTNLTAKPLWTDEFSTIVFSLGNSFLTVPLDQPISLEVLLQPLHPNPGAGIGSVVQRLLTESNHPPLYFVLTHLWLRLFPATDAVVSVWQVRSLAALLGTAAVPASFCLGWLAWRSRLVGQIAAALMAVSPFAIYLAQEARHYTLPILWIIASLACLLVAMRAMGDRPPLPLWVCLLWVLVNALGIATHYFFMLTLLAEGLVVLGLGFRQAGGKPSTRGRMAAVAMATLLSGLVWLPVLHTTQGGELTRWIYRDRTGFALLEPIAQAIGGWITMLYLLPIQAVKRPVVITSVVVVVLLTVWTVAKLYQGLAVQWAQPPNRLPVMVLGGFVAGAIALFFGITYGFGMDLTSAFRYHFVYFPAAIVLGAAGLAQQWRTNDKTVVLLVLLFSLLGGLTVITNQGYQKTHRPDQVVETMQKNSQYPALVAIAHRTHGQTGRLMGIAWEWQRRPATLPNPLFLLAHQDEDEKLPLIPLRRAIASLPRPLDLWLINFEPIGDRSLQSLLKRQKCSTTDAQESVDGYRYALYRCDRLR